MNVVISSIKRIVQRKIQMNSLLNHHCADGGVGEVFRVTGVELLQQNPIQLKSMVT